MRRYWTDLEIDYLKQNYSDTRTDVMSQHLNRKFNQVYGKAHELGLKKSIEFIRSDPYGNTQRCLELGKRFRFVKGQPAINKGVKMSPETYEKTKRTFFKKGSVPVNTKYDGYISLRSDNSGIFYKYIRINSKFELQHRQVYKDANGPIPDDSVVAFVNGNTLDVSIGNLILITKKENMIRNSIRQYPEDLQKAMIAIKKLNTLIKSYEKQ